MAPGGFPARLGELQAAVVAIARVGVPIATRFALGDCIPVDAGLEGVDGRMGARIGQGGLVEERGAE